MGRDRLYRKSVRSNLPAVLRFGLISGMALLCLGLVTLWMYLSPTGGQIADADIPCATAGEDGSSNPYLEWTKVSPLGIALPPKASGQVVLTVRRQVTYPKWDTTLLFGLLSIPTYHDTVVAMTPRQARNCGTLMDPASDRFATWASVRSMV